MNDNTTSPGGHRPIPMAAMIGGAVLVAAIGATAGIMVAPVLFLDPNMMSGVLLYAFAGALLGGITSPPSPSSSSRSSRRSETRRGSARVSVTSDIRAVPGPRQEKSGEV